jgi:hypothetical protein
MENNVHIILIHTMFSHFDYPSDFISRLMPSLNHALCRLSSNNMFIKNNQYIDCEIIGPFPLLHIINEKIFSKKSPVQATLQFGWRVLVLVDDHPVLTMDFDLDDSSMRTQLIQSGFSAINLHEALEFVEKKGHKNNWKINFHQIKIIDLPDLAKSCLWITHSAKGFIPYSTSKSTKEIALHAWNEFISPIYHKKLTT